MEIGFLYVVLSQVFAAPLRNAAGVTLQKKPSCQNNISHGRACLIALSYCTTIVVIETARFNDSAVRG
jgi:hypothetical protein